MSKNEDGVSFRMLTNEISNNVKLSPRFFYKLPKSLIFDRTDVDH